MANSYGPQSIVQDGLVFAVDPVNSISFTSGSATVYDLINPSVSGSVVNDNTPGPLPWTPGYWEFDSTDDFISFSQQSFLESQTNLTISCWVNSNTDSVNRTVLGASINGAGYLWIGAFYGSQNRLWVEYNNGGAKYAYSNNCSSLITLNNWHNIAVVFDASESGGANQVKLYIDGTQISFAATPSAFSSTAATLNPLQLGSDGAYTGNDWDGKFGPTMAYNISLTAAEILQNYNATKNRFQ